MTGWELPRQTRIGGRTYTLHTDYREILKIFSYLQNEDLPEFIRWHIALALFYEEEIPDADFQEAAAYFCSFVNCGMEETKDPGPQLLHWQQDAQDIVADVNRVAGQEIRALPYLHWWTFLSWFHSIGEGNLSTLVSIRDKLSRGKKLESWEQEYYRRNRSRVALPKKYSASELAEQERLKALLDQ